MVVEHEVQTHNLVVVCPELFLKTSVTLSVNIIFIMLLSMIQKNMN